MKRIITGLIILISLNIYSQTKSDANIFGHVVSNGEHIAFANIMIKGTTIGTSTDETGHYLLVNLPEGEHTIIAKALGYKTIEETVSIKSGQTIELDFEMDTDYFGLSEVVITGDRNERNRRASTVPVSTINSRSLEKTSSITISEGLNYSPGLRMENNCQNCGFNQLRMNGLEGPYTQILINSRQIFSGLMGVYGLELIPSAMIDRIEIVRGGGSALYGSSAIGGTVNLILRDPIRNTYEFGVNSGVIGTDFYDLGVGAFDHTVRMNTSLISADSRTGLAIYGFSRNRDFYDANGDGFSEITQLRNTTIGSRLFHRPNNLSKITLDYFNINEDRRGGNNFDKLFHQSDITEALTHNVNTAALSFDRYIRGTDMLSVFVSGQHLNRNSYYGAEQSLKDYGKTTDLSYNIGTHYSWFGNNKNLIAGIETSGNLLEDIKLGYPDFENAVITDNEIVNIPLTENTVVADQRLSIYGAFAQYEHSFNKLKISVGSRLDQYNVLEKKNQTTKKSGTVFVPRANILYNFSDNFLSRISYGKAYRAPQIFDEDLHMEISGSRRVIFQNDPNLIQETSHSFTASFDYNNKLGKTYINLVGEAFYTILQDAFANEFGNPNENGTVIYTRVNTDQGAAVRGVNLELNIIPHDNLNISTGFTLQQSFYEEQQEFNETKFFRTPSDYGFFTIDWLASRKLSISSTGTYIGKMLVPYFGMHTPDPEEGELRISERFFDLGIRVNYTFKINSASLRLFGGVKNIFDSYQKDFDTGINRDSGYIYGPGQPRTINIGLSFGNALQ
jgi:outer membrane receptor for ferrienterochelin and colicins